MLPGYLKSTAIAVRARVQRGLIDFLESNLSQNGRVRRRRFHVHGRDSETAILSNARLKHSIRTLPQCIFDQVRYTTKPSQINYAGKFPIQNITSTHFTSLHISHARLSALTRRFVAFTSQQGEPGRQQQHFRSWRPPEQRHR